MIDTSRSYTVTSVRGCRVIEGWLPITDFVALTKAWTDGQQHGSDDEWLCDALLAQHMGANMVCGPRSATLAWRAELGLSV